MSSSKKTKKSKGKTLALNEFLLTESAGPAAATVKKNTTYFSWADDVENTYSFEARPKPPLVLPTAPKAVREVEDFSTKVPQQPPFTAYISNLPYDANENEIARLFGDLKITSMRIPKDDRYRDTSKLKGFGYVEFENRDNLLEALSLQDRMLRNRHVKIEVATHTEGEKTRERGKPNRLRNQSNKDWRNEQYNKGRENFRGQERSQSMAWRGEGSKQSYDDRRRYSSCMRSDSIDRRSRTQKYKDPTNKQDQHMNQQMENRIRPKLILQPRTKPIEIDPDALVKKIDFEQPSATGSIFGKARPVDTRERERQIEERLQKEKEEHDANDPKYDKKRNQYYKQRKNSYSRTYTSKTLPQAGYRSKSQFNAKNKQGDDDQMASPENQETATNESYNC